MYSNPGQSVVRVLMDRSQLIKCRALSLLLYVMLKSSTTNVTVVSKTLYLSIPGVCGYEIYPCWYKYAYNRLLVIIPAYGKSNIPLRISTTT